MSAAPAIRRPKVRAAAPSRKPNLAIVRPPAVQRARTPFVLACLSILGCSLLATLALNTGLAADAYTVRSLQSEVNQLSQTRQELATAIETASAPDRLAARAKQLGMVMATDPRFLRLADGAIVGGGK